MDLCYDVLIAGAGIAGLYAALQLDKNTRILLLCKGDLTVSGSTLAQGGVAAVLDHEQDSYEMHFQDTVVAGGHRNNPLAVEQLTREGPEDVRKIMELGVAFDSDGQGGVLKTLEGGHSRRRIVHWRDQTGREIINTLLARVQEQRNITMCANSTIVQIAPVRGGFRTDFLAGEALQSVFTSFALLATGGIGRVFQYTTNPHISTGDGIRFAHELGAKIKNLSAVQFHPTAFRDNGECFLISEAVRGEGAVLRSAKKERFMERYDARLELAPRDVVSRSILLEQQRLGDERFYLDITHKPRAWLEQRFPAIYAACRERGVDMATQLIPIYPCQHYLMGGIDVDLESRTTVPRLYAAGECAHTGLHGANRLASNSLPEALVFGRHAAQDITRCLSSGYAAVKPDSAKPEPGRGQVDAEIIPQVQALMQQSCFVVPDMAHIPENLARVRALRKEVYDGHYAHSRLLTQTKSILTVAELILTEYCDLERETHAAISDG